MNKKTELPPMDQMLSDLAKVPGLESFWSILGIALNAKPELYTPAEREIIAQQLPKADD